MAFNKVIVSSGHLTDRPGRAIPRFPQEKTGLVRKAMLHQLTAWQIMAGDLAVCGGARGSDILFAELCADRGAEVWLFISLDEDDFLQQSVRLPDTDWELRFHALRNCPGVKTFMPEQQSLTQAKAHSPFASANIRIVDAGKKQAPFPDRLYALLVWDEQPAGDGPGGTADFVARVRRTGAHIAIINPTKLKETLP